MDDFFDLAVLTLEFVTVPIYSTNNIDQVKYIISEAEIKAILVGNQEQYDVCYDLKNEGSNIELIITANDHVELKNKEEISFS
ncbi:MAG: hypothetical protein R2771_15070 [Saprospiraceae bacterium]